ncbi:hypothetical protein [Chryseobacterium sp. JM1]|uniref:hypothetical protein n=1 Tax=Chryseobacterium sp. JM1 TaxID=1233950 RepID=UPI0004E6EE4A|nr:hypothetical protein [Chryseobacterium sp. JM1]KFF18061.1 hypothetical protein IW22_18950 [Chryseobacterium sp. JM1]
MSNSNFQPPSSIFQPESGSGKKSLQKTSTGITPIYIYEYEIPNKIMRKEARGWKKEITLL